MEIIYLGKSLDTTKEHEIISDNKFGFNVFIKYTDDSWYKNKEVHLYNFTEVYHLWSLDYMGGESIAFESDIHSTGFTRRIYTIQQVNIDLLDKMYKNWKG